VLLLFYLTPTFREFPANANIKISSSKASAEIKTHASFITKKLWIKEASMRRFPVWFSVFKALFVVKILNFAC